MISVLGGLVCVTTIGCRAVDLGMNLLLVVRPGVQEPLVQVLCCSLAARRFVRWVGRARL